MTTEISISELKSGQENRQALMDCADIMLHEASKYHALSSRFIIAKELHNKILERMAKDEIDSKGQEGYPI